jgi:GNAT superfamily N-acetyltransferase
VNTALRALDRADVPAWNRLLADVETVDQTGEHYNEADLVEEMDNPDVELGKDMVGAFVDEQMVGYFCVYPRSGDGQYHKIHLEGATRPGWRSRGIGTQVATAMVERALAVHGDHRPDVPAMFASRGLSSNVEQADLLGRLGLDPRRWSFGMRASLADVATPPSLPDGFKLARYDAAMGRAMFEAHNAAFVDHPDFMSWSEVMWKQW